MCEFCENGKKIKAEYKGSGVTTCMNMIDIMFGGFSEDAFEVAHIENDEMYVDNSSGEYAENHESRQRTLFRLHKRVSYNVLQGKTYKGVTRQSINRPIRIVDTPIRNRGVQERR